MGVWGTGLYSGDVAADLRATAAVLARLPFEGDRLLELLAEQSAGAAGNPDHDDHTTFWLVAADQFHRRGVDAPAATQQALAIIDGGTDLRRLADLGMPAAGLHKRRRILEALREQLTGPPPKIARSTLKKPQPFILEVGTLYAYPTSRGRPKNPYYPPNRIEPGWAPDGFAAIVILDRGRAYDFLTWYTPAVLLRALDDPPQAQALPQDWTIGRPGTCSIAHRERMQLAEFARITIDPRKLERAVSLPPGMPAALADISIVNSMMSLPNGRPADHPSAASFLAKRQCLTDLAEITA